MAKKQDRLGELFEQDIDYSNPINRFALKAKALLNKLGRGMKEYNVCEGAEYGDGSARIYLEKPISIKLIVKFDKEVRKLAKANKELTKLELPIVKIELRSYEIGINFC